MKKLMIYGANGYTGRLASEYAKSTGLAFIVAGRTTGSIQQLASSLVVPYRAFQVNDDFMHAESALKDVGVFLNCAGPFHRTARPLMEACIRNGVHYLDVAAELVGYEIAKELDQEAKNAKVMIMPGCGGSVTMLGCLAVHVVEQIDSPTSIDIALHVAGPMSRGSAISAREGSIGTEQQGAESERTFDFGDGKGPVLCFPTPLPDLITISKATGITRVRTFVHVSGTAFPTGDLADLPAGPTTEERNDNPYHAAVEVTARDGTVKSAVLHALNGYSFTSMACIEIARRVMAGEFSTGFQTPVGIFGSGFVDCIKGSTIENL